MPTSLSAFVTTIVCGLATLLLQTTANAEEFIRLEKLDGRYSFIAPNGTPFFPHGVNHISPNGRGEDAVRVAKLCWELGFNAYGYGSPEELHGDMPFVESWHDLVPISLYYDAASFAYHDIFDQADIRRQIKKKCDANRDNRNLIGYFWTDLPVWTLQNNHGTNWVKFCRELPASDAGKKAYVGFLQSNYKDLAAFNAVYQTGAANWESLLAHRFDSVPKAETIQADDLKFLRLIAREYYAVLGKATRQYDPNHLVFGDRLLPSLVVDEVIEEMLQRTTGDGSRGAGTDSTLSEQQFSQRRPTILPEPSVWMDDGTERPGFLRCSCHARLLANPHGQ